MCLREKVFTTNKFSPELHESGVTLHYLVSFDSFVIHPIKRPARKGRAGHRHSCVPTTNSAAALQEGCSAEASEEEYFALAFGAVDFEQGKKVAGRCREASLNLRDPGARCCHCLSFPESPDWPRGWAWYLSFPFCSFWSSSRPASVV